MVRKYSKDVEDVRRRARQVLDELEATYIALEGPGAPPASIAALQTRAAGVASDFDRLLVVLEQRYDDACEAHGQEPGGLAPSGSARCPCIGICTCGAFQYP